MRSIWSGSISFGLVNVPVNLYSATSDHDLDLNMLHKKDLSPIRYAKFCKEEEKEIPYEEVVKGYEVEKGRYVVLDEKDFKAADARKTGSIDIVGFAAVGDVDPIYFEKPYFVEPGKGADKAYALLREALKKSGKVGIVRFVLRQREHLGALKPEGKLLVLDQLRYKDEIRDAEELRVPDGKEIGKRELEMALKLIEQLTHPFKPEEFKDTYVEELKSVIEEKAKGKIPKVKGKAPKSTKVTDLMATLQASIEQSHGKVVHMHKYKQKKKKAG